MPYWLNEDKRELDSSINCPVLDTTKNVSFINSNTQMTKSTTTTPDFLPADYTEPSNSDYVKLDAGTTKLRFLQSPIISWEMWEDYTNEQGEEKRRVIRGKKEKAMPIPMNAKLVWICLVWNYNDSRVQIWSISQKTIRDQLVNLSRDEDYGNPLSYDIKIKKE